MVAAKMHFSEKSRHGFIPGACLPGTVSRHGISRQNIGFADIKKRLSECNFAMDMTDSQYLFFPNPSDCSTLPSLFRKTIFLTYMQSRAN